MNEAGFRVLVAEDSIDTQRLIRSMLRKLGIEVELAENGRQALEALKQEDFDVVLMDIQMPIMDGYLATAEIRRREASSPRHTPIIAMTAHAMKGDRERCLEAGMDGYVAKPIRAKELLQTIDAVLELSAGDSPKNAPA